MINHFKTALKDGYFKEKYKDKPLHMATLASLAKFVENGHDLLDVSWLRMTKTVKKRTFLKKAA